MKGISNAVVTILVVLITIGLVAFSYTWFLGISEYQEEPLIEEVKTLPSSYDDKVFVDRYNKDKINIKEILGNVTYQIQDDLKTICQYINKTHLVCEPKIEDCYCEFYIAEVEFGVFGNRTCLLIDDSCEYTNLPLSIESLPIYDVYNSYFYEKYMVIMPLHTHQVKFVCYLS